MADWTPVLLLGAALVGGDLLLKKTTGNASTLPSLASNVSSAVSSTVQGNGATAPSGATSVQTTKSGQPNATGDGITGANAVNNPPPVSIQSLITTTPYCGLVLKNGTVVEMNEAVRQIRSVGGHIDFAASGGDIMSVWNSANPSGTPREAVSQTLMCAVDLHNGGHAW